MKGIILAGGTGSRLMPLTKVTNKHLLAVWDKPMIYYPLQKLLDAGIKDILIVSGSEHSGHFLRLLCSGKEFNAKFTYEIQDGALGIAHALSLAEDFADGKNLAVILGDNIFEDILSKDINSFKIGAKIFLKEVPDANRFGVAEIKNGKVIGIEEKPKKPKSNYAVTGFYLYDSTVFDVIEELKPSQRGELEITDVNNHYIKSNSMTHNILKGFWSDAGTFASLHKAAQFMMEKANSDERSESGSGQKK